MKKLFILSVMVVFLVAGCGVVSATELQPQFEDYKWGSSIEEVREIVTLKGHHLFTQSPDLITYLDRILDEEVMIALFFTPKTRKLYLVVLSWDSISVGNSLLRILTKKYGTPDGNRLDSSIKWYWWGGDQQPPLVMTILNLEMIDVYYTSQKYIDIKIQEENEIEDAEVKGKF